MDDNDKILQLKQNFKKYLKDNVKQESIISQIHSELDFYYNSLNISYNNYGTFTGKSRTDYRCGTWNR